MAGQTRRALRIGHVWSKPAGSASFFSGGSVTPHCASPSRSRECPTVAGVARGVSTGYPLWGQATRRGGGVKNIHLEGGTCEA